MSVHITKLSLICRPTVARWVLHSFTTARAPHSRDKVPRSCAFSTSSRSSQLSDSPQPLPNLPPPQYPYNFYLAASWAAKPVDSLVLRSRSPFPPDTVIGMWRDRVLSGRRKKNATRADMDAGEDFFFIQEVSILYLYFIVIRPCIAHDELVLTFVLITDKPILSP